MEKEIQQKFNTDILRNAADCFGFQSQQAVALDGFENFLFEVPRNGQAAILRISHSAKKSLDLNLAELEWLSYLSANGADVVRPLPSQAGNPVEVIPLEDGSYFNAVCFEKIEGRHPEGADFNEHLYEAWGRALGKIHRLSRSYQPANPAVHRPRWDEEVEITRAEVYLRGQDKVIAKLYDTVARMRALPQDARSFGLVHNDAHPHNFLTDGRWVKFIDFDDCVYNWYLYDLAYGLFSTCVYPPKPGPREDFARELWPALVSGYRQENELEDAWLEQVPLFLQFCELGQYIVIHRACDLDNLDPWPKWFMNGRRERIENNVPYLDMDFKV